MVVQSVSGNTVRCPKRILTGTFTTTPRLSRFFSPAKVYATCFANSAKRSR